MFHPVFFHPTRDLHDARGTCGTCPTPWCTFVPSTLSSTVARMVARVAPSAGCMHVGLDPDRPPRPREHEQPRGPAAVATHGGWTSEWEHTHEERRGESSIPMATSQTNAIHPLSWNTTQGTTQGTIQGTNTHPIEKATCETKGTGERRRERRGRSTQPPRMDARALEEQVPFLGRCGCVHDPLRK